MSVSSIPCDVPGVTALEGHRKGTLPFDFEGRESARDVVTERLYICANGLSLGARRGGRLHLAGACEAHPDGADTWEIFTFDERGVRYGASVGWVDEATLQRAVRRLARWSFPHCAREVPS